MDKKKKVIVSTVATGAVVVAAGVGIGLYMNNDVDDKAKKEVELEEQKYNKFSEVINKVGVPTLFDEEEKNPFKSAYVSNSFSNDVYIEFHIFSESGKEMKYVISTNGDQFYVTKNDETFKEKELENGQKVYTNGTSYYWHDEENKAYVSLDTLSPEDTKAEDLEKAIQSIGQSKFDIWSKLDFGYENINIPTYTIGESEPMEIYMDFDDESISKDGKANRIVNLIYTDVEIGQSETFDFTDNISEGEVTETVKVNGKEAKVVTNEDSNIVKVYYKYNDTHYVIQVGIMTENDKLLEDTEYAKEELLKVLESMSFE